MNESSRIKLQSILNSMETEADPLAVQLETYQNEINKLELEIDRIKEQYSEADFVFSPRTGKQNEEYKQKQSELELLKKKCEQIQERYDQINQSIDLVVEVLASENDGDASKNGLLYQEQDRQRIARDLHDTALQHMSYLVSKLDSCKSFIDTDPIKAKMELSIARHNLSESIDEIRGIIYNLRPMVLDSDGFHSTLIKFIEKFNEDKEFDITYDIEDLFCEDQLVLITIYRIIEECFSNIKKHA